MIIIINHNKIIFKKKKQFQESKRNNQIIQIFQIMINNQNKAKMSLMKIKKV